ncbi:MAG: c-type cytochrome [Rhizobiales bacterium]|nr:c-type cytochrome [Hyphomicrobiales bacterium]
MKFFSSIRPLAIAALGFFTLASGQALALEMGDAEAGDRIFRRCKACHATGEGAGNGVGPMLNGILCRPIGSVEDYRYSNPMQERAAEGGNWTVEALNDYLENPSEYLDGRSRMTLKLRKEEDRLNVIAFLAQLNADGTTLAAGEDVATCE